MQRVAVLPKVPCYVEDKVIKNSLRISRLLYVMGGKKTEQRIFTQRLYHSVRPSRMQWSKSLDIAEQSSWTSL